MEHLREGDTVKITKTNASTNACRKQSHRDQNAYEGQNNDQDEMTTMTMMTAAATVIARTGSFERMVWVKIIVDDKCVVYFYYLLLSVSPYSTRLHRACASA